jgi:hypothetical protein
MYSAPKSGGTPLWKTSLLARMTALPRTLVDDQAVALATAKALRVSRWRPREESLQCRR